MFIQRSPSIPNPPPSVYESWPAPNTVDPETRGHGLTITNSILIVVVIAVVLARCYTRIRITGSFGLDDMLIIASMIPGLGLMCCEIVTDSLFGWNRHIWDASAEGIRGGLQLEFAAALLYIWSSVLTKISVVMFCRRLLSPSHPEWYRAGLNMYAVITAFGCIVYTVVFCFACQPLSAYWDHTPPNWEPDYPYKCIDIARLWMSGTILNCSWDALTWLVPLPIIYQLRLPIKQRRAVMALFLVGICVVVASIMKTIYIAQAFDHTYDVTWVGWPTWICGALEVALGIVCASAPALRPFFSHFLPHPAQVFGNRHSYAQMSRGVDVADPFQQMGMDMPLSPLSPTHKRVGSIASGTTADDMKPWAYNSRTSSRATSRRGSLGKLETNLGASKPNSLNTTPATLTPGSPASKRLTPVREVEPSSGVFTDNFRFNRISGSSQANNRFSTGSGVEPLSTDPARQSPIPSPEKTAAPGWLRTGSRLGARPRTGSFGGSDRERKGSVSTVASNRDRKDSVIGTESPDLKRNVSIKSDKSSDPIIAKPGSPLKSNLYLDTEMDKALARIPNDIPRSAVSTSSRSIDRHSHKASSSREFEGFNFDVPATTGNRRSTDVDASLSDLPPPPSYGEFVENNSWIRDDRTVGRRSVVEGEASGQPRAM